MDTPLEKDWIPLDSSQVPGGLGLVSSQVSERLNQVDRVRANGVGDHLALPQLVVCGDQSAGKSSVLESISGIPFPRRNGVSTRFATEIILRHELQVQRNTATILPHMARTENEKAILTAFRRDFSNLADLPGIIDEAVVLMGEPRANDFAGVSTFTADVLRLEVFGDTGLHLTLVDLPGIIFDSEKEQDVKLVHDLANSYLENPRTIILAVVPAGIDVKTHSAIQRARRFDKDGLRTVGIITMPDMVRYGTEVRVAKLVNNADGTELKLGFFLLGNPSPMDLEKGATALERQKMEDQFFASYPWNSLELDFSRVGIDNLRVFLQDLLNEHIERELPKLRKDVAQVLAKINSDLMDLGSERTSPTQIRVYLTRMSTDFQNLVKAGVEGMHGSRDGIFHEINDEKECLRLRAAIHVENGKFANYMRTHGQKRKVVSADDFEKTDPETGQILVTREQMSSWIKETYNRIRGRDLSGNHSHALLGELFHTQSSRWGDIARNHITTIADLAFRFVQSVAAFVIKDPYARKSIGRHITAVFDENTKCAFNELSELLDDEAGCPITYNHYYTDNVQNARNERLKQEFETSLNDAIEEIRNDRYNRIAKSSQEVRQLVTSLRKHGGIVDMEERACYEAQIELDAYYKIAMTNFVDNVCRQVIERHILTKLPTVFEPTTVSGFSNKDLLCLAAKSPKLSQRRIEASQLRQALEDSLRELR